MLTWWNNPLKRLFSQCGMFEMFLVSITRKCPNQPYILEVEPACYSLNKFHLKTIFSRLKLTNTNTPEVAAVVHKMENDHNNGGSSMMPEVSRHHLLLTRDALWKKHRSINLLHSVPGKSRGDVHFTRCLTLHLVKGLSKRTNLEANNQYCGNGRHI